MAQPLWRSQFVAAIFGIAHFIAGPFWCKFHENNFFILLFSYFSFFNL